MASVVPPRNSVNSVNSTVNNVTSSVTTGVNVSSARPSFSEQISALGARISRAISRDGSQATATTAYSTETSASTHVGEGLEKLKRPPQAPDADTTCELKFSSSIVPSFSCSLFLAFSLFPVCCRLALATPWRARPHIGIVSTSFLLHSEVRVPSCARQSVTVRLYVPLTPSRPNIQTSSSGLPTTPLTTEGELLLLPLIILGAWCTASATHRTSENLRGKDSDGVDTNRSQIKPAREQRAEGRRYR